MIEVPQSVAGFLTKRIRQFHGVQELILDFYRRLDDGRPVPVSVADAIPVLDWVERVARAADAQHVAEVQAEPPLAESVPILITGAAGALGSALVARLLARGERLRLFVRRRPAVVPEGVEIATGDLGDPEAVDRAVRGAQAIIHAGAATTKGGLIEHRASTVVGTQNVVESALRHGVKQFVYISSMSVVDWAGAADDAPITESSSFEPHAESRGAYTQAKKEAGAGGTRGGSEARLAGRHLAPGPNLRGQTAVARRGGRAPRRGPLQSCSATANCGCRWCTWKTWSDGVVAALDRKLVGGEVIQLVDTDLPTQNEILARAAAPGATVVRLPRRLVFALGKFSEVAILPLKRQSPLNVYRLRSAPRSAQLCERVRGAPDRLEAKVGVSRGIREMVDGKPPES